LSIGLILFIALIVGLGLGVPIAVAIGMSVLISFIVVGLPMEAAVQRMYAAVDSFTLMAIPFFMLAGSLMEGGGMSKRLVRFANSLVGTFAGGLAHVQVLGSCFFAALSGSSPATTAAIGSALIPEMTKKGYPPAFSAAVQSVAGTIGPIIPPSIPMVVYCVIASESIGEIFAAGVLPGLLYGGALMVLIYIIAKKNKYGTTEVFALREVWDSFKDAIWALLVPLIILGGIYSGIFTPTEAGAVAAVYGLLAGIFIYKELNLKNIASVFIASASNTAMVLLIVAASCSFSWLLNIKGVAAQIGTWFMANATSQTVFLLLVFALLLFMGCFMETIASVLIVTPILLPVAQSLGINTIFLGLVICMTLSLGMATPPVGENLYIACSIANVSFEELIKNVWPFILAAMVAILLVIFIPEIGLWLPSLIYK